jgi:hypothetical protein
MGYTFILYIAENPIPHQELIELFCLPIIFNLQKKPSPAGLVRKE